jgi:hypothetical protein
MNENSPADLASTSVDLPCEAIVYRAALEESWFSGDGQTVDPIAFYRRRGGRDDAGVSIGVTPYAHRNFLNNPIAGVISVHVGHVRDVADPELQDSLYVEIDNHPHGNIKNVPFKEKRGPRRKLADRVASLLARTAARTHEIFDPPHN